LYSSRWPKFARAIKRCCCGLGCNDQCSNGTGNLLDKHDAKGQDTVYTYDSLNRVTEIQRYPNGKSNGEDTCARVTYTYDTNPVNSSFSKNSTGRLTTAQYAVPNSVGEAPVVPPACRRRTFIRKCTPICRRAR